jgi:hypothetical protein
MPFDMTSLCAAMRRSIEPITLDWVARVKADPFIRSDDPLTLSQLVDHVPQMLEELCGLLQREGEPDIGEVRASSSHGYTRSLAGYSLTELLRELELLRDSVFNFVAKAELEHGVVRTETIRALRVVNQYFGEDIIFVVEHYLRRDASASASTSPKEE